jgi:hypothetical protein
MKPITLESKALAACVEVAAAAKEVKRFAPLIGEAIACCETSGSHLTDAYAFVEIAETDYSEGGRQYLTPEEQMAVLAACPHCLAAHNAIQERKKARRRLSNARRQITMIGRAA